MGWHIVNTKLESLIQFLESDWQSGYDPCFNPEVPQLVVYEFDSLNWTGVAKVAPKNHVLWATEIPGQQSQYESGRAWANSLLNDEQVYSRFNDELRKAGLDQFNASAHLFGPYCGWGSYLGKSNNAFQSVNFTSCDFVYSGMIVPSTASQKVISLYKQQINEFSELAFWKLNECDFIEIDFRDLRRGYKDGALFKNPKTNRYFDGNVEKEIISQCSKLEELISAKDLQTLNLHYTDAVRPNFDLVPQIVERSDKQMWLLYLLQIRLMRKLRWPNFYVSVFSVPDLIEQVKEKNSVYSQDLYHELRMFKEEMESRYPVLLVNALDSLC
ncbi:hypothetical protein P886_2374 [Alteromonadaceae bacterium 2753L.S.0a.02]|nr:hypothetical protein P886_2374 [Alteromonadaceae bacterium 2753L.S.0a.02]